MKDKIVVVTDNLPKGVTFNDLQGKAGDDWFSPQLYAQANGAKAVIVLRELSAIWRTGSESRWTQTEKGGVEFGNPQTQVTIPTITAGRA